MSKKLNVFNVQVIGMNEYGDGMFSQIVTAKTKGKQKLVQKYFPFEITSTVL